MKTPASPAAGVRFVSAFGIGASLAMLFFSGCATVVPVTSAPPGASVSADGKSLGTTPAQLQVENANKPVTVHFTLPGYFPKTITYTAGSSPQPISVRLEPTKLERSFEISSEPSGATVMLEGRTIGNTPVTVPVQFTRNREDAPWTPQRLNVSRTNYQTETFALTSDIDGVPAVTLTLLKDDRTYTITAANVDGAPLNAPVRLDGSEVGRTPLKLPITYQRADKLRPWPKFNVAVEILGQYKPATAELTYTRDTAVALKLDAITEIMAKIIAPSVFITPTGAKLDVVPHSILATLRTSDDVSVITDLKQVTRFERQDLRPANRLETITGFTVTPDGQNIVFALTEFDEGGNPYSNLWIKRAEDSSGGVSRLTQGTRYLDAQPFMANDSNNYLVFTSNRGDRSKSDVFRVTIAENRLSGGVARLTNDNRFNFLPTYGDSNRQLFYLSIEAGYPKAEVQLSSIRFDGSLPTQLPIVADEINNLSPDKVYFVKMDPETRKKQIYSITADGKLETALPYSEDFRKANCFDPCASADGQRVLFVSDRVADPKDRPNNDVYAINADGTNLRRITFNESDDTQPVWSPTEDGVIYFLSTRGGATNIWRAKLVGDR